MRMTGTSHGRRAGIAAAAAGLLALASPALAIETNINKYICQKLDDFTASMHVVNVNERELGKISKDAILLYRLKNVQMKYKEPNMVRIEGSVEGAKGVFVLNGSTQYVAFPKMNLRTRRDFGNSPGKRKTLMDVGLVSAYYLSYTDAKFLRESTVEGTPCGVFDLTFKGRDEGDRSHQIVYIDPVTKVVRRREAYSLEGKLQAVYLFKDVKEVKPGIWFPTIIEAYTTDRTLAGTTAYKDIHVNVDIPDSVFRL